MINGIKKITRVPSKRFHEVFGTVTGIPDFLIDKGINGFPNQETEQRPYECTGEAVTDILSDVYGVKLSPDFSYAAGLDIEGIDGQDPDGCDMLATMEGAIGHGVLALASAPLTAQTNTEAFCSDFNNWPQSSKDLALNRVQNGVMNVLGNGDAFDSIVNACYLGKQGVSVGTPWFPEFFADATGIVQNMPNVSKLTDALGNPLPWHNWAVKGKITFNNIPYVMVKSWQGAVGDKGWLYFNRETINAILSISGTGAFIFNPNAIRWVAIVAIICKRFPQALPLLPKLLTANTLSQQVLTQMTPTAPVTVPVKSTVAVPVGSKTMQQMVIRICGVKGLNADQSSDLYATIHCESNFNPSLVHPNIVNGVTASTDYGICQVNDYWHIGVGKDFPSVAYVLSNPDKCVEWMCDMWLAGKQDLWVCFSKGLYLKYK